MNVIELHSELWTKLQARRAQLPHSLLFAGQRGLGKFDLARAFAASLLCENPLANGEACGKCLACNWLSQGNHPDFRLLQPDAMAEADSEGEESSKKASQQITIDQVRGLLPMFATTPSLGNRRVVVIDAIDDLERAGANALLKSLEEPPAGTVFLLVSHAPGRLLPTIRSRCRLLRFSALDAAEVRRVIRAALPEADEEEVAAAARAGEGSPGRALRFAGLDVAALDAAVERIMRGGDPGNAERVRLVQALSGKAAQARYEAFLDRAPAAIAAAARTRTGAELRTALDAHRDARELTGTGLGLSLDAQATVFEMGGVLARLASRA